MRCVPVEQAGASWLLSFAFKLEVLDSSWRQPLMAIFSFNRRLLRLLLVCKRGVDSTIKAGR
jgi:hypothetical protein